MRQGQTPPGLGQVFISTGAGLHLYRGSPSLPSTGALAGTPLATIALSSTLGPSAGPQDKSVPQELCGEQGQASAIYGHGEPATHTCPESFPEWEAGLSSQNPLHKTSSRTPACMLLPHPLLLHSGLIICTLLSSITFTCTPSGAQLRTRMWSVPSSH